MGGRVFPENFLDRIFSRGVVLMRHQFDLLEQTIADQIAVSGIADLLWCNLKVSVVIFSFVETKDFNRFCCSCLLFYCDHSVIAFSLTEHRLAIRGLLDWEAPSPPVERVEPIQDGWGNGA